MRGFNCGVSYGIGPREGPGSGIESLTLARRKALLETSGIRHAAANGLATSLVAHACRSALVEGVVSGDRLGILVNGGPWALDSAITFLRRAATAGPNFVNPLTFPTTLVSSTPTAVAAALGARAFAYSVGHDELAFFDMLRRARQALSYDHADEVLAVAVSADSPMVEELHRRTSSVGPVLNVSIAFSISRRPGGCLTLIDATVGSELPWEIPERHYEAVLASGELRTASNSALTSGCALSASAAVICSEAIRLEQSASAFFERKFVVSIRTPTAVGAALFLLSPSTNAAAPS